MATPLMKLVSRELRKGLVGARATETMQLVRITQGTRTAGALASGTNASVTRLPCQGFESHEKHDKIGDTLVDATHKVVCLVGDTLGGVTPTSNDKLTVSGVTYPIVDVEGSPALWTVLVKA